MIKNKDGSTGERSKATPQERRLAEDFGREFDLDFGDSISVVRQKDPKAARLAISEAHYRRNERVPQERQLKRREGKMLAKMFGLVIDYDRT